MPQVAATADSDLGLQLHCTNHNATGVWPDARSAHNFVAARSGRLLLLLAGDSGKAGQRFNDLWLCNVTDNQQILWNKVTPPPTPADEHPGSSCCHQSHWYTARSNATAAVAGDWLVVFGGWDSAGLRPLAALEVFNITTGTWTSPSCTSLRGPDGLDSTSGPSPRGQPAAAFNTAGTMVYVFGGWDGHQRYNDLWRLTRSETDHADGDDDHDGQQWIWQLVVPAATPTQKAAAAAVSSPPPPPAAAAAMIPCARADHVMVCWHYCDDGVWKDLLVVFGGSSSSGLLNDTWLFDIRTSSWTRAYYGGRPPCPRSSCAAAITGDTLLLHGGQTAAGEVLSDMLLLLLSSLTWIQVDLSPVIQPLCRHSMVVTGGTCWIFGGYTGSSGSGSSSMIEIDLQPMLQMRSSSSKAGDLVSHLANCDMSLEAATGTTGGCNTPQQPSAAAAAVLTGSLTPSSPPSSVEKVLSKCSSPGPVRLSDLPDADQVSALPQWKQIRHLHQAALAAGCDTYIDPQTGYSVFTAKYLKQRECCGNKCRHCPWGWKNVADTAQSTQW